MKINLMYGVAGFPLDNYLNISPFGEASESLTIGSVQNLDEFVDNGEATEIIADNVLEYVPTPNVPTTLSNWVSKLKIGGKLVISFMDATLTAKDFANYRVSLEEFNNRIHGSQEKPYLIKRSSITVVDLCKHVVETHNMRIIKKRINDGKGTVEFERVA